MRGLFALRRRPSCLSVRAHGKGWWRDIGRNGSTEETVEASDPADDFDGSLGRPSYVTLRWPDLMQNPGVVRTSLDVERTGERVPKDLEDDMADAEGDAVDPTAFGDTGSDLVGYPVWVVGRYLNLANRLFQRRSKLFPHSISAPYPDQMSGQRLLCRMEGRIFRIWYDAHGRVNVIKYECRLYRPKRKRLLGPRR